MDSDVITEGRAAWERIRQRERQSFADWIAIGRACAFGRADCMQQAGCSKPYGRPYLQAMGKWLRQTGFDEVHSQERYWALAVVDNLDAITKWRDGLDDRQRRRFNHPQAIWSNWRKSLNSARPNARHDVAHKFTKRGRQAPRVHWTGEAIKRAATAMRESRSNDFFILARVALENAIRDHDDLLALLDTPSPQLVRAAVAA